MWTTERSVCAHFLNQAPTTDLHQTLVVAHRGASQRAPENTLSAFRRAVEIGVDAIECDVHLTADGRLAVIHDARIDRTTDGSGPVRDLAASALATFRCANGERVPLLPEVLDAVGGRAEMMIELKAKGTPAPAVSAVHAAGLAGQTTFISFDLDLVGEVRRLAPEAATGALFGQRVDAGAIRTAAALGCRWVQMSFQHADRSRVDAVRTAGLRALLWTPDTDEELRDALAMMPDAITTDRPDALLAMLQRS